MYGRREAGTALSSRTESHAPGSSTFPSPQKLWGFTCSTRPERGSITRSFLSLHVVVSRLPSVLKDMQRITSKWQSIIFTGSPTSRFQMRTCGRWRHVGGGVSPVAGASALGLPPTAPGDPEQGRAHWEQHSAMEFCIKG